MLVLQDFFGVIVHRSFYTQPTIMGFHNHWNNPWLSHNMRFHKFLVRHFIIILKPNYSKKQHSSSSFLLTKGNNTDPK